MEIKSTKTVNTVESRSGELSLTGEITLKNGVITNVSLQVHKNNGKFINYNASYPENANMSENIDGNADFVEEGRTFAKAQLAEYQASLNSMEGQE